MDPSGNSGYDDSGASNYDSNGASSYAGDSQNSGYDSGGRFLPGRRQFQLREGGGLSE